MYDLNVSYGDFEETIYTLSANTPNGKGFMVRHFGDCIISVELYKSSLQRISDMAAHEGVSMYGNSASIRHVDGLVCFA